MPDERPAPRLAVPSANRPNKPRSANKTLLGVAPPAPAGRPLMPSLQIDAEPTVLVVGNEVHHPDLEQSLAERGIYCERASCDVVGFTAVAVAPDLVLLVGDAAGERYDAVLATLRRALRERTPPIAVVTSTHDLATRLDAFRRGAVATFADVDEPEALAEKINQLIQDLSRGKYVSASVGESSLEELLGALSHELRTELCDGSEAHSGPVRLVLGGGKPLAIALREFVMRVKRNVVNATPLPVVPAPAIAPEAPPATLPKTIAEPHRSVDGIRIILADEDAGRADVVARALRALGATVLVTDLAPSRARIQLLRALDPQVLLAGDDQIPGRGLDLLRLVRDDVRLRWASLLVLRWDEVWPDESSPPAVEPLLGTLAGLTEVERGAEQRCAAGLSFSLRLESIGPVRLLRALEAGEKGVRLLVDNPRLQIEVELCAGQVESALARPADGDRELSGLEALSALSVLHAGEVTVEPQAPHPEREPLGSLDELLSRLDQQPPPVVPSVFPDAFDAVLPPPPPVPAAPAIPTAPAEIAIEPPSSAAPAKPFARALARAAPLLRTVKQRLEPAYRRARTLLARPIKVGSLSVPLGLVLASGVGVVLALVVLVTVLSLAFGGSSHSVASVASSTPRSSVAGAAPVASLAPAEPKTQLERAGAGETAALDALLAIPADQRTAEQAFAVATGQEAKKRHDLAQLMHEVQSDPKRLKEHTIQKRLIAAARSPITGAATLKGLAAIDASEAADLIYEVWTGTRRKTPMTELAESLVHSETVKRHASPALAVALALRATKSCDATKRAVERALDQGDRRSLVPLARLTWKRGCGPHKANDCYPCLRGDHTVRKAMAAVKRRRPPL